MLSETMTSSPSVNTADLWQFGTSSAQLRAASLRGEVTLGDPSAGVGKLFWNDAPLQGSILGVSAGPCKSPHEAFVRGTDLVAEYTASQPPAFDWQVYWRVTQCAATVTVVDAILSFQTALLESFPRVTTRSQLVANEVYLVDPDGQSSQVDWEQFAAEPRDDRHCVVLRAATGGWSYAEMTHPDDQGNWQLAQSEKGPITIGRTLGGSFLEKGVIRRLRVRGVFLPAENDLQQAAKLFTELATATPPLTA
jgi:hypothetical protein